MVLPIPFWEDGASVLSIRFADALRFQGRFCQTGDAGVESDEITNPSKVIPPQSCPLGYASQHSRPDFLLIVKGKLVVCASWVAQKTVRASLAFYLPPDPLQRCQHSPGFSGWPTAHRES